MPSRITEVSIQSNTSWKIVSDASNKALLEAAVRIAEDGGAQELLREHLNSELAKNCDDACQQELRKLPRDSVVINVRTDEDITKLPVMLLPVAKYGNLTVVDREEIESYRAIRLLLRDYIKPPDGQSSQKPLSLAVFGPPGSGKSFGIKELIGTFAEEISENLEFNISQFSRTEELTESFLRVSSAGKSGVPVVFFDEFDSALAGKELGWLKYFLAPMQDGKIIHNGNEHNIGRSVFVFAGGTSHSFRAFSREDVEEKDVRGEFEKAKGTDFTSRLAGHLNVLGVNRQPEGASDQSYVIRRALILRSEFRKRHLVGRTNRTLVDREFVRRLIEVGAYTYGARSINKVLEMCIGPDGKLHIPPAGQLAMHIGESDVERLLTFSGS